ncbi:OmpP1/FadL family transporter [Chitinimonas naiadis]
MKYKYLPLLVSAALGLMAVQTQAAGYRFGSQSVAGQGNADANGAQADDASAVFYNPAGLSRLKGTQFSAGATLVLPESSYTDNGSKRFTGTQTGGGAPKEDYVPHDVTAPSMYFSTPINDQLTFGVGMFVPYGTKLNYGNNWAGRYALSDIKLESVDINPSMAFKLDEHHSFGFGVTAEFMKASLGQAVDVPGSVMALNGTPTSAALIKQIVALGGNPAALANVHDGHGENNGKDWGYGFNLGYMYQLDKDTRFGLAYRSAISHKLKGDTVWDFSSVTSDQVVNKVLAAASHKVNSGAQVDLKTPETLSANAYHQINDQWAAMADITWTRNSRLQDLHIQFPGTTEGDEVIRQQWKNTYRVSLGANYRFSDSLLLRSGLSFDQSPVRGPELTHPALPDSDRVWYSIGANYKINAQSSVDVAYSYVDFKDANISYTNQCNPLATTCTGNGETTNGTYKTHIQFLGVSYNYLF